MSYLSCNEYLDSVGKCFLVGVKCNGQTVSLHQLSLKENMFTQTYSYCNGQLNILAKALDNSETAIKCFHTYILVPILCWLFSSHMAWEQHYPCADPTECAYQDPEYGGGPI